MKILTQHVQSHKTKRTQQHFFIEHTYALTVISLDKTIQDKTTNNKTTFIK